MDKLVSIIVPCYNLIWQTELCIKALAKNVDYPFEVIVVNNNSTDGTKEFLNKEAEEILKENDNFIGFIPIHNNVNKYLSGAINIGIKYSSGDFISIVANDIVVPKNMYSFMIEKLEEDISIGAIGPWYTEHPNALKLNLDKLESVLYYLDLVNNKVDEIKNNWHFSVCHIMRRDAWNKIGKWDENLVTHCQDNDWGMRLEFAGYKAVTYKKFICYHHYGSLGRKQIKNETGVAASDILYFANKWGIHHPDLKDKIPLKIIETAKKGNYLL